MLWRTSPDQLLSIIKPKAALDVLNSENKSLNSMMLVYGLDGLPIGKDDTFVKAVLTVLIVDTLNYFSVGVANSMNAPQIGNTITMILEEYSLYKIDFFVYCFENAKKGYYGTTYNRIDGQIIFDWLAKADKDYGDAVELKRINELKKHTNGLPSISDAQLILDNEHNKPVPMPENVKELIKSIGKKETLPVKETAFSEEQKRINELVKDFDAIFDEQDDGKGGKRFIYFDHRMMDVTEYMEYRIKFD